MEKIYVKVRNRVAQIERPYPYDDLLRFWSYSVPNFNFIRRYYPSWDGKKKLLKYDKVPAGLFWATRRDIERELGIRFVVDFEHQPVRTYMDGLRSEEKKYRFQNRCTRRMVKRYRLGKGGLILNATGTGKTRIAAMFFSRVKGRCLFIVDQIHLLEQSRKALEEALEEKVGYVGDSKFKLRRVTVATIQTLYARLDTRKFERWFRKLGPIIIDEIHEQLNERTAKVLLHVPQAPVFGLTATLQMRKKDIRLPAWSISGPVLFEYPLKQGVKDKVLADGVVVRVLYENKIPWHERRGKKKEGLYQERIVANPERNSILSRIASYGVRHGRSGIVLVRRLEHMSRLSNRLKKKDIVHKLVAGTVKGKHMKLAARLKATDKLEKGKLKLIISNQVFKKGIDIKRVDMIIDGAAMKSKNDALQKYGRGVRLHRDKEGLLYFDLSDVDTKPQYRRILEGKKKGQKKLMYHNYHASSRSRRSAYKGAGIQVIDFEWGKDGETKELFEVAEKALRKELKGNRQ